MKTKTSLLFFILLSFSLSAQTQFFKSDIPFTNEQNKSYFSAFAISGNNVVFIANDYKLYSFDKNSGKQQWVFDSNYKTGIAPYIFGDTIITGFRTHTEDATRAAFIDKKDGSLIKNLPFGQIITRPLLKNGMLYCTTYEPDLHIAAGLLLAYDIKNDTVAWNRPIDEIDSQPVYLKDRIISNSDYDHWFEVDYNNKILLHFCDIPPGHENNIYCVNKYLFLSHDNKQITSEFINKFIGLKGYSLKKHYAKNMTFIMSPVLLMGLGENLKVKNKISQEPKENMVPQPNTYYDILKADDTTLWYINNHTLTHYNLKKDKAIKTYNLAKWQPHQVVLDGNTLWLINRADGQLYGLTLD